MLAMPESHFDEMPRMTRQSSPPCAILARILDQRRSRSAIENSWILVSAIMLPQRPRAADRDFGSLVFLECPPSARAGAGLRPPLPDRQAAGISTSRSLPSTRTL